MYRTILPQGMKQLDINSSVLKTWNSRSGLWEEIEPVIKSFTSKDDMLYIQWRVFSVFEAEFRQVNATKTDKMDVLSFKYPIYCNGGLIISSNFVDYVCCVFMLSAYFFWFARKNCRSPWFNGNRDNFSLNGIFWS